MTDDNAPARKHFYAAKRHLEAARARREAARALIAAEQATRAQLAPQGPTAPQTEAQP